MSQVYTDPKRESDPHALPKRADHCTHPRQSWCDCDWCRINGHWFVRSEEPATIGKNAARS